MGVQIAKLVGARLVSGNELLLEDKNRSRHVTVELGQPVLRRFRQLRDASEQLGYDLEQFNGTVCQHPPGVFLADMTGAWHLEYVGIAVDDFATGQQLMAKNSFSEIEQESLAHCAEGKLAKHALVAQLFFRSAANQGDQFRRRDRLAVLNDDDEFCVAEKLDATVRLQPGGFVACQAAGKHDRLEARAEALRTPAPHGVGNAELRVRVARS